MIYQCVCSPLRSFRWRPQTELDLFPLRFAGDETFIAPDGAVYDIFYPQNTGIDEKDFSFHAVGMEEVTPPIGLPSPSFPCH